MLIAGIVFLVLGTLVQTLGFLIRGSTTGRNVARGRITDLRRSTSREFGPVAYPEITYTLPSGHEIVAESSTVAAEEDGEVVGAEVQVRYDPNDPQKVDIDNGGAQAAWKVFVGLGILFDLVGIVLLVLSAL